MEICLIQHHCYKAKLDFFATIKQYSMYVVANNWRGATRAGFIDKLGNSTISSEQHGLF
jgi:hypothetical protein